MGKISEKTIEEIKRNLRLSDVFRDYAQVTNKGNDKWVKCPFHSGGNERTASCKVDDDKDHYYCFGCKATGTMFTLIMEMEHLTFPEAVRYLAEKAGVQVEEENSSPADRERQDDRKKLLDLNERMMKSFHYLLMETDIGQGAREYLERRHVSAEMIERFQLGYAPGNPRWLHDFLRKKGYSDEFLREAGYFSRNKYPYPLFCNRLMFPVRDYRGHVVAFSGRDLSGREDSPKYINSPETAVYSKKHNAFGIYESLKGLKEKGSKVILLEGNFDVIAMHQAGFTTAVAPLGTAFTEEQCRLLSRYTSDFELMFDSDRAGQDSTDKAINIVCREGGNPSIHRLTSCKDAGETVEKLGVEGLEREFRPSTDAYSYLEEKYQNRYNISTPGGKRDFLRAFSSFIDAQKEAVVKDDYMNRISFKLGVSRESVVTDLEGMREEPHRWQKTGDEEPERPMLRPLDSGEISEELRLMLICSVKPEMYETCKYRMNAADFQDPEATELMGELENRSRNCVTQKELFLSQIRSDQLRAYVSAAFALPEYTGAGQNVADELMMRIQLKSLHRRNSAVTRQLEYEAHGGDLDSVRQLNALKKEITEKIRELTDELTHTNR